MLPADVAKRVAHHVHYAQLHDRSRVHSGDGFREPLQAIDGRNQEVLHAAVLQLREDAEPEARPLALALAHPEAEQLLVALDVERERHVDGTALHMPLPADLKVQGVEEDHRVEAIQRP